MSLRLARIGRRVGHKLACAIRVNGQEQAPAPRASPRTGEGTSGAPYRLSAVTPALPHPGARKGLAARPANQGNPVSRLPEPWRRRKSTSSPTPTGTASGSTISRKRGCCSMDFMDKLLRPPRHRAALPRLPDGFADAVHRGLPRSCAPSGASASRSTCAAGRLLIGPWYSLPRGVLRQRRVAGAQPARRPPGRAESWASVMKIGYTPVLLRPDLADAADLRRLRH